MREVFVLCEGPTEEQFIKRFIAPSLHHFSVFVKPQPMSTSKGHYGGAVTYDRLRFHAKTTLKQHPKSVVTTFIDLYALDTEFPAFEESKLINNLDNKTALLNQSLTDSIVTYAQCDRKRFIAHIQPHEFEGLLFSDPQSLSQTELSWVKYTNHLWQIRNKYETPEHINGGYETCPSRRLNALLNPKYNKTLHATRAVASVTLTKIEQECVHFRAWLNALRALAS